MNWYGCGLSVTHSFHRKKKPAKIYSDFPTIWSCSAILLLGNISKEVTLKLENDVWMAC